MTAFDLMMILFLIHNDRDKMINYLQAHPSELIPLFRAKAKKLNYYFTSKMPNIIDLELEQHGFYDAPVKDDMSELTIKRGDLLFNERSESDQRWLMVNKDYVNMLSKNVIVRVNSDKALPEWLYEFLKSPLGISDINSMKQNNLLGMSTLAEIKVPMVSLEQQRKSIDEFNKKKQIIDKVIAGLNEDLNTARMDLYDEMGISKYLKITGKSEDIHY